MPKYKYVKSYIINYQYILHKDIFWVCYVSLNIHPMHEYRTFYVSISVLSAKCQMTLPIQTLKISSIQIYPLLQPWRFQHESKTKVILLLLLFCTLQASKLPIDIFQIAGTLMAKNTKSFLLNYSWNLDFHSLMDTENKVIYSLCRRNLL